MVDDTYGNNTWVSQFLLCASLWHDHVTKGVPTVEGIHLGY